MGANAIVFDPGFWAWRASWGREANLDPAFRALANLLLSDDRNGEINSLVHHLRLDAVELHAMLEEIGIEGGKIPDDTRLELDLLQAVRLALIMRVFILAAQMPRFATREISHRQLFEMALMLDVPAVVLECEAEVEAGRPELPHGELLEVAGQLVVAPRAHDQQVPANLVAPQPRLRQVVHPVRTGGEQHDLEVGIEQGEHRLHLLDDAVLSARIEEGPPIAAR